MWVARDILDEEIPAPHGCEGEKNTYKPNYADKCTISRSSKGSSNHGEVQGLND